MRGNPKMKKKTITIILAFTLCMSLSIPILATNGEIEVFDEVLSISNVLSVSDGALENDYYYNIQLENGNKSIGVYGGESIMYATIVTTYRVAGSTTLTYTEGVTRAADIYIVFDDSFSTNVIDESSTTVRDDGSGAGTELQFLDDGSQVHFTGAGVYLVLLAYRWYREDSSEWYVMIIVEDDEDSDLPGPIPDPTPPAPEPQVVNPTASTVYLNGEATAFEAYLIDGYNYFKLRDLAYVLSGTEKQFEVGYDEETMAITLTSGEPYTEVGGEMTQGDGTSKNAIPTPSTIYLDGEVLDLVVYNIAGNNFFKLRDLMQAIDVYVGYDDETMAITLDTSRGYVTE